MHDYHLSVFAKHGLFQLGCRAIVCTKCQIHHVFAKYLISHLNQPWDQTYPPYVHQSHRTSSPLWEWHPPPWQTTSPYS